MGITSTRGRGGVYSGGLGVVGSGRESDVVVW